METEKENKDQMMSAFAKTIMDQKYAHVKEDGTKESWEDIADRVVDNVTSAVAVEASVKDRLKNAIKERKFIPGGRYLRCAGLPYHPINNCLLFRAEDSREGWADLMHRVSMSLMSGGGIGVVYSDIREKDAVLTKTGGKASGPIPLMQIINEVGRGIMNAGERRCAIWSGLHWNHPDALEFTTSKDWSEDIRYMKQSDYNFPAKLDMTNISVILDDDFFTAYDKNDDKAHKVYWSAIRQMLQHSEPGFSVDVGKNKEENLRNAPVTGTTYVLTKNGYRKVVDIVNEEIYVWTGKQWAKTIFKKTGELEDTIKVTFSGGRSIVCSPEHPFIVEGKRVEAQELVTGTVLTVSLPDILKYEGTGVVLEKTGYTLGYIYGDGSFNKKHHTAEASFCTSDSKKCIEGLDGGMISSITESDSRGYSRVYFKKSDLFKEAHKEIFPEFMYRTSFDFSRSFIAGLFDSDGNYYKPQNRIRLASIHKNFLRGVSRLLEEFGILSTITKGGISTFGQKEGYLLVVSSEYVNRFRKLIPTIRLKIDEHTAYRKTKIRVIDWQRDKPQDVYCCDVGVEEHSFMAEGVIISNCTEITSEDDSDVCNLGSINMARVSSLEEMKELVELGVIFLLAGTEYSHFPTKKSEDTKNKNRRLGLGLMGIHEWLLSNGYSYSPCSELEEYLKIYSTSGNYANKWADTFSLSRPLKTRAIAPVGSIGIIGETTTGIEPLFCVAYKRRYFKEGKWFYQYVIDPTAKRLIDQGISPEKIEDSYSLAQNVEKRVAFQAWVQQYVDHAISSTINLPAWGSEHNNEGLVESFGNMLLKYLPQLRGITVYADGSRSGQPLNPVKYSTAIKHVGEIVEESGDVCDISGKGGSCGS